MPNIKVKDISVSDNQKDLSNKLNYNFHLLSDYINEIKTIKGERGPQGVPGVQGAHGERGDKGSGVYYCPYKYEDTEDFNNWCNENNVTAGSIVIDSDGNIIGCSKSESGDLIFTLLEEESITTIITKNINESVQDETATVFRYLSQESPLFLDKYLNGTSNKGIILSNNYKGEKNVDIARSYISMFRYENDYINYSKDNTGKLNGIVFGCNNESEIDTNNYLRLTYDTYKSTNNNYFSELLFSHISSKKNATGFRFNLGDSSTIIGSGQYIGYMTKSDISNDPSVVYENAVCLRGSSENKYMFFGYGTLNSEDRISVFKTSEYSLNFSLNGDGSTTKTYIFSSTESSVGSSNITFSLSNDSLTIKGNPKENKKSSNQSFEISGGSNGTSVRIKGGAITLGNDTSMRKYGSVCITGGDVIGAANREYALGGAVFIKGGSSNNVYHEARDKFGPVYILSGKEDNYSKYITDHYFNTVFAYADEGLFLTGKDVILRTGSDYSGYVSVGTSSVNLFHKKRITIHGNESEFEINSKNIRVSSSNAFEIMSKTVKLTTNSFKFSDNNSFVSAEYNSTDGFKFDVKNSFSFDKDSIKFLGAGSGADEYILSINKKNGVEFNVGNGKFVTFVRDEANGDSFVFKLYYNGEEHTVTPVTQNGTTYLVVD